MPESDLQQYARYAAEHLLPSKRQDFYMAQLTWWLAASMGGYKGKLTDFMLGADKTGHEAEVGEEGLYWNGQW